jgi:hypothetical protein
MNPGAGVDSEPIASIPRHSSEMPTNQTGIPFAPDFQLITEPKPVPRVELQIIGRPSVPPEQLRETP